MSSAARGAAGASRPTVHAQPPSPDPAGSPPVVLPVSSVIVVGSVMVVVGLAPEPSGPVEASPVALVVGIPVVLVPDQVSVASDALPLVVVWVVVPSVPLLVPCGRGSGSWSLRSSPRGLGSNRGSCSIRRSR